MHQKVVTTEPFYTTKRVYTRGASMNFTPEAIYTTSLSHQKPFTPKAFYANGSVTRCLLHHKTFTLDDFYQKPFTPDVFLHQPDFTPDPFAPPILLHQKPFTSLHRKVLHQRTFVRKEPFWPTCLLQSFTPEALNTRSL